MQKVEGSSPFSRFSAFSLHSNGLARTHALSGPSSLSPIVAKCHRRRSLARLGTTFRRLALSIAPAGECETRDRSRHTVGLHEGFERLDAPVVIP
jgi:hypothetical protein